MARGVYMADLDSISPGMGGGAGGSRAWAGAGSRGLKWRTPQGCPQGGLPPRHMCLPLLAFAPSAFDALPVQTRCYPLSVTGGYQRG